MDLKQLHMFLKVCEYMNITEAAKQLNYSQSAVSEAIAKLEKSLGVDLFERIKRRIYLTDKGETLKIYAQQMIRLENEIKEVMDNDLCQINVGIIESLAAYKFSRFFREYLNTHHDISINFVTARCEEIPTLLKNHHIDFGITLDDMIDDSDIHATPLFDEEIVFIKSYHHQNKNFQTFEDLNGEKVIISKGYAGYNILFFDTYTSHKLELGPITYMESLEGIKSYVKEGFGISFMPYTAVETDLGKQEIEAFYLEDHHYHHTVQVLEHKHRQLKMPIKAMIQTFIKEYKKND